MEGIAPLGTLGLQHAIAQLVKALADPARALHLCCIVIFGHEEVRYGSNSYTSRSRYGDSAKPPMC